LANKCAIASRIDCFSENQTNIFGDKLRQQVDERLEFFISGKEPKKNINVMIEALEKTQQMLTEQATIEKTKEEKKKNNKRKRSEVLENNKENEHTGNNEANISKQKKKNKKS
jgi:nucleolar protein 56